MGIKSIIEEWCAFRVECLRRTYVFELGKKSDKLHLLYGLRSILLDIDKAIAIIRGTENEDDVVPNLMKGFSIDEVQAEFVADIKLRNLNRQHIIKRVEEIEKLEKEIEELKLLISSERRIKTRIVKQLADIAEKYGKPRKTYIIERDNIELAERSKKCRIIRALHFSARRDISKSALSLRCAATISRNSRKTTACVPDSNAAIRMRYSSSPPKLRCINPA